MILEEILKISCVIVFGYGLWQLWKKKNNVTKAISGLFTLLLLLYFLNKML